ADLDRGHRGTGRRPPTALTRSAQYLRSHPAARYQFVMSDREPALLGDQGAPRTPAPDPGLDPATAREPVAFRARREPAAVYVVGFWRRLAAAAIDLAIVIPAALIITLIASRITGLRMPMSHLHL